MRTKKIVSWLLIIMVMLSLVPMEIFAQGTHKLIIHYNRDGGDYDGWNLWLWEEGKDGKAFTFNHEDDYGVVLVAEVPLAKRYGFLLRKGNWDAKDIGTDRFIEVSGDTTEIWLSEGVELVNKETPTGFSPFSQESAKPIDGAPQYAIVKAEASVQLRVHYRRFDTNYEGWNLWIWPKSKEGKSYNFTGTTDFGAVADIPLDGTLGVEEIGFIIRKGEWEAKDVDTDRFISVARTNAEGILEVFIVQGTEGVYFDQSEIDLSPKFLKVSFIDDKAIRLITSMPVSKDALRADFTLISASGHTLKPTAVSAPGDMAQDFVIVLPEAARIGEVYKTRFGEYAPLAVDPSGLFDTPAFEEAFGYQGKLGAIYSTNNTLFKVWSPVAQTMMLNLYKTGHGSEPYASYPMGQMDQGVWSYEVEGDLHGVYYTYSITTNDIPRDIPRETYDPYANSAGVNGDRSMVVDFSRLQPQGWLENRAPVYDKANDIVVWEIHIRDMSNHPSANSQNPGKYLGMIERGTQTDGGMATGLDHLLDLGITHVQILPMYDFNSVDESRLEENIFNWGYDPKNFNAPEGSYASDPYDGSVRVLEMRQMIQGYHDAGIGVIMDVVYNHTALSGDSNFNTLVPNYYYRMTNGGFSNASGTGNETASERIMYRNFMLDSLKHWVVNYDIDGFRFDLMGVHDIETMRLIEQELRVIKPGIILYGEGWTGGASTLREGDRLVKSNMQSVEMIGAFNDDFRDAIKGHVFNAQEAGFAGAAPGFEESLKFGFVGAGEHPQIDYKKINYSKKAWTNNPSQSINYVSAHDNLTLWDKFLETNPEATDEQRVSMHKLSNAMVLTSQGVPFLHAGVELLRTKNGDHNSYKSSDEVNNIIWTNKETYPDVYDYYKGLIALRKAYPILRLSTAEEVASQLKFYDGTSESQIQLKDQMVGFTLANPEIGDGSGDLILLFNGALEDQIITLPQGTYGVLVNKDKASDQVFETISGGEITLAATSALVLSYGGGGAPTHETTPINESAPGLNTNVIMVLLAIAVASLGAYLLLKKK